MVTIEILFGGKKSGEILKPEKRGVEFRNTVKNQNQTEHLMILDVKC